MNTTVELPRPQIRSSGLAGRAGTSRDVIGPQGVIASQDVIGSRAQAPLLERLVAGSREAEDRMKQDWRRVAGAQVRARFEASRR